MLIIEIYIRGGFMKDDRYTLKEVCEKTSYKPSVIRYYEKEFKINIPRDSSGRRYFTDSELNQYLFIKKLQQKGYTNPQIKKAMEFGMDALPEIAVTSTDSLSAQPQGLGVDVISYMDEKFNEITSNISQLNQAVSGQERDLLISENMKLKMELKQKSYELMETKERLRYEKEGKNKGLLKRIFYKG
jgi:DNA-binding transcriptional MerR regulator